MYTAFAICGCGAVIYPDLVHIGVHIFAVDISRDSDQNLTSPSTPACDDSDAQHNVLVLDHSTCVSRFFGVLRTMYENKDSIKAVIAMSRVFGGHRR